MKNLQLPLRRYLIGHGWIEPSHPGPRGGLWRHPESNAIAPLPNELFTDSPELQDLLRRVAVASNDSVRLVERAVLYADVDMIYFRAANPLAIRRTIPYDAGAALVQQGWRMLRSCATTARGPRSDIDGRYSSAGDAIVRRAEMGHTLEGSFVVPVMLPLSVRMPLEGGLELGGVLPDPEERRVSRTLGRAMSTINSLIIQSESEPSINELHELVYAGVSRELLNSIYAVLTSAAIDEFETVVDWAPEIPAPQGISTAITLPTKSAELIRRAATKLPNYSPGTQKDELLIGQVIGVHREPHGVEGDVTVLTYRHGREVRIRIEVSATVLRKALTWIDTREDVVIHGKIARGKLGLQTSQRDGLTALSEHLLSNC